MKITLASYKNNQHGFQLLTLILIGVGVLVGCNADGRPTPGEDLFPVLGQPSPELVLAAGAGQKPTATPVTSSNPVNNGAIWLDIGVPDGIRALIPQDLLAAEADQAAVHLGETDENNALTHWVYLLVAPFPTLEDEYTLDDVRLVWKGLFPKENGDLKIFLSKTTLAVFEHRFGKPSYDHVTVKEPEDLLTAAWEDQPSLALIPFEELNPRWKVLKVNGASPLETGFFPSNYPLVIPFGFTGSGLPPRLELPTSNRIPEKLTTVLMTGTTALVRATGAKMEKFGMTYPAGDIMPWFENSDLVHISNEVSFLDYCPPANAYSRSLLFCSRPEYIELLEAVGTDIVELTGNHLVDYSREALVKTLQMYKDRGMAFYGGGMDLFEAQKPLLVENNGNRLAFMGCNSSGPPTVWAEKDRAGAASCDYSRMIDEIRSLKHSGYLPIVSLQHFEYYIFNPAPLQVRDFNPLAEAGAVIVSGSQSHYPQGFAFIGDSLIHYGLGNLFFDQMWMPVPATGKDLVISGTRREFLDRHVFYDGKFIGTEVLTAMLEDFSRPRPMTLEERRELLADAFSGSQW